MAPIILAHFSLLYAFAISYMNELNFKVFLIIILERLFNLNEVKGVVLGSDKGGGVGLPALGGVGGERVGVDAGAGRGAGRGLVGAGAGRKRDEVEGGLAEGSTFL